MARRGLDFGYDCEQDFMGTSLLHFQNLALLALEEAEME